MQRLMIGFVLTKKTQQTNNKKKNKQEHKNETADF